MLERNPGEYGFDYHFIMPASLDIPPYYYVENGKSVEQPTDTIEANNTPGISPIQGIEAWTNLAQLSDAEQGSSCGAGFQYE